MKAVKDRYVNIIYQLHTSVSLDHTEHLRCDACEQPEFNFQARDTFLEVKVTVVQLRDVASYHLFVHIPAVVTLTPAARFNKK